jgi:hypothetical protein
MCFSKGTIRRVLQVLVYFPVSFSVIGLLAYHVRFPSPVPGRYPFKQVFLFYANPFKPGYSPVHFYTLIFCSAFLLLLLIRDFRTAPIVTMTQLRIILLVLLTIVTLLVDIFFKTLIGLTDFTHEFRRDILLPLFLHVDVHLALLYLWTYLPFARARARA